MWIRFSIPDSNFGFNFLHWHSNDCKKKRKSNASTRILQNRTTVNRTDVQTCVNNKRKNLRFVQKIARTCEARVKKNGPAPTTEDWRSGQRTSFFICVIYDAPSEYCGSSFAFGLSSSFFALAAAHFERLALTVSRSYVLFLRLDLIEILGHSKI